MLKRERMQQVSEALLRAGGSVIAALCLASIPLPVLAGALQLQNKYADCPDVTHEQIVQDLYNRPEIPFYNLSTITSEIREMYEALFEPPAVKIPFSITSENFQAPDGIISGFIYYSEGDLFVETLGAEGNYTQEPIYNFATIGGDLYTWETGADTGRILTRYTGDTVELIDYFADPALRGRINYANYKGYINSLSEGPQTEVEPLVSVTGSNGNLNIAFGDLTELFYSLPAEISEEPTFWVESTGITSHSCYGCGWDQPRGFDHVVIEVNRPIPIEAIPPEVQVLPEDVTFEQTTLTANTYMRYWLGHSRQNYYEDGSPYCEAV